MLSAQDIPPVWVEQARQAESEGRWEHARAQWLRVLEKTREIERIEESHRALMRCTLELDLPDEALKHAHEALKLSPGDVDLFLDAIAISVLTERYDLGLQLCREVNDSTPNEMRVLMTWMDLALISGDLELAGDVARDIVELDENHFEALLTWARSAESQGHFDRAERIYLKLSELAPDRIEPYLALVSLAARAGRIEEALVWNGELISRHPDEIAYRIDRSVLLEEWGDYQGALDVIDEILQRWPDRPELRARSLQIRADALRAGMLVTQAQRERDKSQGDVGGFLESGRSRSWRRHLSEARRAWRRILETDPDNLQALSHEARASFDLGDWQSARKAVDRALELAPDDPRTLLQLDRLERATSPAIGVRHFVSSFKDYDPVTRNHTLQVELSRTTLEGSQALSSQVFLELIARRSRSKETDLALDEVDIDVVSETQGFGITHYVHDDLLWGFRAELTRDEQDGNVAFPLIRRRRTEGGFAFVSLNRGVWTHSLSFARDRFFLRKIDPLRVSVAHLETTQLISEMSQDAHVMRLLGSLTDLETLNDRTGGGIEWDWTPGLERTWLLGMDQTYFSHPTSVITRARGEWRAKGLNEKISSVIKGSLAYDHHSRVWEYGVIPSLTWNLLPGLAVDCELSYLLEDGNDKNDSRSMDVGIKYKF